MFSTSIITLLMLSASLKVEAFDRKRLNVKNDFHGDESETLLSISEFGEKSVDLEKLLFEDMRILQTMSMSAPTSAPGTTPTSSSSSSSSSEVTSEVDSQATDTDHTPSSSKDPIFDQPEDPDNVPFDINVDMCTNYDDFYTYTDVKKTLQYDYAVEVRDATHKGFASDIASEIRNEIKTQLCGTKRRLNQPKRILEELGTLLGYHVKSPQVKSITCPERAGSCFEVIGDVDFGIIDTPGQASKKKLELLINSVVQDFTDSNVIATFEPPVTSVTVDSVDTVDPIKPTTKVVNNEVNNSSKNNTGLIAAVASIGVFLILAVIAVFVYKKSKRSTQENVSVRKDEGSVDTDESDEFATRSLDEHIAKNSPRPQKGDLSDSSTVKVKNDHKIPEVKLNP